MSGQIQLDNPSRGSTTLLSQCTVNATSSQVLDGSTPNDGTGDEAFNAVRRIKQWAADLNAMLALFLGTYLGVVVPPTSTSSSPTNNYDPTGGAGTLPATSRIDFNPGGNSYLSGLLSSGSGWAITDEKILTLRNISTTYTVTLGHQNAGSSAANQFWGPGEDFVMQPGMVVRIQYWAGTVNNWVILP